MERVPDISKGGISCDILLARGAIAEGGNGSFLKYFLTFCCSDANLPSLNTHDSMSSIPLSFSAMLIVVREESLRLYCLSA